MKLFVRIFTLIAALWCVSSAYAQSEQDDRGYLQAFLEDNLSDVGRDIRIVGFSGAFSSSATVEQITVADDEGIWLTMNGLVLEWTRSGLLRGAIDISELSAEEIIIARRPIPIGGVPAPEASGFSLPEIPVSIEIGVIKAARVELAEPVIGEAAVVRLEGAAMLSGGEGSAKLDITRTDGPRGALQLDGSYSNATKQLDLALTVDEGEDGIAANILDLPDRPAIGLSIVGTGPVSDFVADIELSTAGKERLTGQVKVLDERDDTASSDTETVMLKHFDATLAGDIAPVLLPAYRDFFGENVKLAASGRRFANGALELEALELTTEAMTLKGDLALAAGGWPHRFSLSGRIADNSGAPVLLPITGTPTQVRSADLVIGYDADDGDTWRANFILNRLSREDLKLDTATVSASGALLRGDGAAVGRVDGDVSIKVLGIAPKSGDLATAIGPSLSGKLSFDWQEDAPLKLTGIDLSGSDYQLSGGLVADEFENGITVKMVPELDLIARDLTQFADLAKTPLTGAANLGITGKINLLGGAFDLVIAGTGKDLGIGQKQFDPLIQGESTLDIAAIRDAAGTRLERLDITTEAAIAKVSADLKTGASAAKFDIQIADTSLVDPGLNGPAQLVGTVSQNDADWTLAADVTAPGDLKAVVNATLRIDEDGPGWLDGKAQLTAASLSPYAQLAGQPISGGVSAIANGKYNIASGQFEAQIEGSGSDLGLGQPNLDALIRGSSTFMARAHRDDSNIVFLDALSAKTPELSATATGRSENGRNALDFNARLRDIGVLADGISGPATASGTATLQDDAWQVALTGNGPGGVSANVNGSLQADASRANLKINGTAPLALANRMIQPRLLTGQAAFDLSLNGPLELASLTGTVQTSGARLALPTFRQALDINSATATLSGGRANLGVLTSVVSGGRISAQGDVSLTSPYQANLQVDVDQVVLTDGELFETSLDGSATVRGPLTDGATLRGDLALGRTEIRIADVPASTVPIMAELEHINEPAAVRQTRSFAGLIVTPQPAGATARPYPIDIVLRAPTQLFVRGRGLDAELGGQLRLTGTSANVVPVGQFDLIRGRLDILGKRLNLTEGRVSLQGAFDPYLFFVAETSATDTQVRINVIGPASAPEVTFTSSPELPEDEVLALLLFGRDIAEISPLQALKLAAAVRTLAGKGGDGIVGRLRNNFALDDLDLTTDENGEATLKAGKYISENIYTDVTVGANGDTEINLNLTISPSVTARGSVGDDGESTIGIFFERDY